MPSGLQKVLGPFQLWGGWSYDWSALPVPRKSGGSRGEIMEEPEAGGIRGAKYPVASA